MNTSISISKAGKLFWGLLGLAAVVFAPGTPAAQPVGIVVYKRNPDVPSHSAFEYIYARPAGQVCYFGTTQGKKVRLLASQVVAYPPYPAFPTGNIVTDAPLVGMINRYRAISSRYPVTKRFVDPRIAQLNQAVNRIRNGEVIYNGSWISKSEYERLVEQADKAAEEFAKRKKSSKRAASSMSSKERLALRRKVENACHKD